MTTATFHAVRLPNSHDGESGELCVSASSYDSLSDLLKLCQADAQSLSNELNRHKIRVRELYEENQRLRERLESHEPKMQDRIRSIHSGS